MGEIASFQLCIARSCIGMGETAAMKKEIVMSG